MNALQTLQNFIARLFLPLYRFFKKRFPARFEHWNQKAGNLDLSAMLTEFNLAHRFFFRNTFEKIHFQTADLEKVREATQQGPIIYLMKNWGQIEYNFFNSLFLKENLPLATHANLIRMTHWIPFRQLFYKFIAKMEKFEEKKIWDFFPEEEVIPQAISNSKPLFYFLNLPALVETENQFAREVLQPILNQTKQLADKNPSIIPLNFLYDRRPSSSQKSIIDILFGEKENPGSIRKLVLFFRNYRKRAVAQIGSPIPLKDFLKNHAAMPLAEQALTLSKQLQESFFKEARVITGPLLKNRTLMVDEILEDKQVREGLLHYAKETEKPTDAVYLEAQEILQKIAADPNYSFIDFWNVTLKWAFKNIYEGLQIDKAGLEVVKKIAKEHPIILVPSHRSHVDYLLLSYIFYNENLSIPMIAAGENLSFWPMGYIFRKSGAYFIRRSFGEDKLYPFLFKAYLKHLIQQGYFQEFFIEGTRSRTGKLEQPRTGLLSLLVEAYREGNGKDLYFVPISIDYEKVLEEGSYVRETRGASKQKESTGDLLRVGKYLRNRYGEVYVRFASPLSLKDFLAKQEGAEDRASIEALAKTIAVQIENISTVTAPALVATGLLAHTKKGQSLSDLQGKIDLFFKIVEYKKAPLSEALQKNYPKAIQDALSRYANRRIISQHHDGSEFFYTLPDKQRSTLNYYKNNLIHLLIGPALLARILIQNPSQPIALSALEKSYEKFSEIFSQEFVHIDLFETTLKLYQDFDWLSVQNGELKYKASSETEILSQLLNNFIQTYRLTLRAIQKIQFVKLEEKSLIKKILELGENLYLKGDLNSYESISQFSIQNALRLCEREGLLKTHEKEMGKRGRRIYSSVQAKQKMQELSLKIEGDFKFTSSLSNFQNTVNNGLSR